MAECTNVSSDLAGEAGALAAAQRQMPVSAVWGALESADVASALRSSPSGAAAHPAASSAVMAAECAPLWGHPPLAAILLQQPQVRPQAHGELACSTALETPDLNPFAKGRDAEVLHSAGAV